MSNGLSRNGILSLVSSLDITQPLQVEEHGDRSALSISDSIFPIWVKLTQKFDNYPDGAGVNRTAFGWTKQRIDYGGQWVDSEENISGMVNDGSANPLQWPAFPTGTNKQSVGDIVQLYAGLADQNPDETINHGVEWWIVPGSGGGQGVKLCGFTLYQNLAVTDATQANCTVNDFTDGSDPTGIKITVANQPTHVAGTYLFSGLAGYEGTAVHDTATDQWWILQLECVTTGGGAGCTGMTGTIGS